jgi:hypothetical protein
MSNTTTTRPTRRKRKPSLAKQGTKPTAVKAPITTASAVPYGSSDQYSARIIRNVTRINLPVPQNVDECFFSIAGHWGDAFDGAHDGTAVELYRAVQSSASETQDRGSRIDSRCESV